MQEVTIVSAQEIKNEYGTLPILDESELSVTKGKLLNLLSQNEPPDVFEKQLEHVLGFVRTNTTRKINPEERVVEVTNLTSPIYRKKNGSVVYFNYSAGEVGRVDGEERTRGHMLKEETISETPWFHSEARGIYNTTPLSAHYEESTFNVAPDVESLGRILNKPMNTVHDAPFHLLGPTFNFPQTSATSVRLPIIREAK